MQKGILYVILGVTEVIIIIVFSIAYGVACIFLGWLPDLSLMAWLLIAGFLSISILVLSFGLWHFTSYQESIHGWILLPGIFVGKIWIISNRHNNFQSWLSGSIIISLLFIILLLSEAARIWFTNKSPEIQKSSTPFS